MALALAMRGVSLDTWPAAGGVANYLGDTKEAENSEFHLLQALDLVGNASGAVLASVLGHSHGNKLVIRAFRAFRPVTGQSSCARLIAHRDRKCAAYKPRGDNVKRKQGGSLLVPRG